MSIVYNWEISLLNDFYGVLLTQNQSEIVSMYYDENLSLGEISSIKNISRNAVRDTIIRATKKLEDLEDKLNLIVKTQGSIKMLEDLKAKVGDKFIVDIQKIIDYINNT
ncbi:MAG: sigma factor-like helix-turn-helix DNA-binding protein [Christensenellales bacterium]|jgi:predicted DNA-binding protein YlxM (UPF0122 family)|nr:DNA-binding protein [Clostridiales bacterium]